jgi:hypothetical protein
VNSGLGGIYNSTLFSFPSITIVADLHSTIAIETLKGILTNKKPIGQIGFISN